MWKPVANQLTHWSQKVHSSTSICLCDTAEEKSGSPAYPESLQSVKSCGCSTELIKLLLQTLCRKKTQTVHVLYFSIFANKRSNCLSSKSSVFNPLKKKSNNILNVLKIKLNVTLLLACVNYILKYGGRGHLRFPFRISRVQRRYFANWASRGEETT